MSQTVSDTSCRNCKYLERLDARIEQFQFKCPLDRHRANLIVGSGATQFLTFERDGETVQSTHMLLSMPQYVSCEHFEQKLPE